jgi:TRAP-type C4-dicarboxylate transport system substrate-binding protein
VIMATTIIGKSAGVIRQARFRRGKHRSVLAAALGVLAVAGCASSASTSSSSAANASSAMPGPTLSLKFADLQNVHTATTDSADKFAQLVQQYTDGKITIKVYPNSELGTVPAQLAGTEAGTIAFYATPDLSAAVAQSNVLGMPYLFPSVKVASEVLNSAAIEKSLWSLFPAHGLTFIGSWVIGYTSILTKSTPINSPANMKGLKIRVFAPTVGDKIFSSLGADAVSVAAPEVVTALSTGVVNGADDPASTMVGSSWYSGMCCLAETNDTFVSSPLMASTKVWNTLSSAEQSAIKRAFNATISSNMSEAESTNAAAVTTMQKAGLRITKPDIAEFKSATEPVYAQIENLYPGQVQALQAEIKKVTGSQ